MAILSCTALALYLAGADLYRSRDSGPVESDECSMARSTRLGRSPLPLLLDRGRARANNITSGGRYNQSSSYLFDLCLSRGPRPMKRISAIVAIIEDCS